MKAMILAGGLSTRLYPLTKQVPKPLVPVALAPNAVHVIRYLASFGYDEIALNVYYHSKAIVDRLGDGSAYGVRLHYLHEPELLGSAGAVKQMEEFLSDDDFVVIGCDDLTDLPLNVLVEFHRERKALATIGLVPRERVEQYGVVLTARDGRITGFQEKPVARNRAIEGGQYGRVCFQPKNFRTYSAGDVYRFRQRCFSGAAAVKRCFLWLRCRGCVLVRHRNDR